MKKDTDSKENNKKKAKKHPYIFRVFFAIFGIILIYIIFSFSRIFNRDYIKYYEVTSGEIVNVDRHTGVIYKDEKVESAKTSGYVNFFVANAERVNKGAFIYTITDDESVFDNVSLDNDDKRIIKQNIKRYVNSISNLYFYNIYTAKNGIDNQINELSIIKQLEKVDFDKEITAKEKGYAKHAGLVSFVIDGYEDKKYNSYDADTYKNLKLDSIHEKKREITSGDKIYKIVTDPTFYIAFDSSYDYDNYKNKNVYVKFVYENIKARAKVSSFIGADGKKHFLLSVSEYPESFIDKRTTDFEIENKKVSGLKIPIKSIISKNCYIIPKNMLEKDFETDENVFFKLGLNGEKIRVTCNVSKEDDDYYYISIDDSLSGLKYGDVLVNRYNDVYSLSEVRKLDGVYNLNKGYAIFKNVDIIDKTNEYAIVKSRSVNGIMLYDHIALDASSVEEGDFIS